jgi:hypothetical protein
MKLGTIFPVVTENEQIGRNVREPFIEFCSGQPSQISVDPISFDPMISQLVDGNRLAKAVQLFRHRYIPLVSANRKQAPFAAIAQKSRTGQM